ncbi:MAG: cation-translocating P-type ATPase [Ruthenibacterium sp.]
MPKKAGLSQADAAARLGQVGENRLHTKPPIGIAALFFSQFKDVMILILAAATIISVLMGEGTEAITIIIIVLLNASMGFFQEYRTEKTLEALKELSAPTARVRRDGKVNICNARTVVPGDVLLLEAGDKIAADTLLDESSGVLCNEAMLTGESAAAEKQAGDKVFAGCTVLTGHGEGVVTATGMATEMGKIATMIDTGAESPTPLQMQLKQLGRFVATACVVICLSVGMLGYLQGGDFWQMLLTGVSLAVAAIPEGLPAIVTITLALSVNRILRRGAVIRKLHAVETLGCAGVICTDKTGTVTQNKMTVQRVITPENAYEIRGNHFEKSGEKIMLSRHTDLRVFLEAATLCTAASLENGMTGDATELAVLVAAQKAGIEKKTLLRTQTPVREVPFDAKRKRMSVEVRSAQGSRLVCKGAPEMLLPCCTQIMDAGKIRSITPRDKAAIMASLAEMAAGALRVLGVAVSDTPKSGENNLCFLGLCGMMDPPRPEVKPAVQKCRAAGIRPVMITGDHKDTALAVARAVGIARAGEQVLDGAALDTMTDAQLAAVCMKTAVYARVSPAHKLRIVKAYKAAGQVVAMTGDGVNDAPAVKEADIGVAMGITGTDVTKEASGVVILDDNFATIVAAIEEGRVIYQNIRRFLRFLLTSNLGEVLGMLFGMILGLPVTLLPIQILLVNLFTDGLPAIALGLEPPAEGIMRCSPRKKTEGLFANGLGRVIFTRGIMLGMASCGAYWALLAMTGDVTIARSACFLTIVCSQMLHIFECRGEKMHFGGNPALLAAVFLSVSCAICCVYLPFVQPFFGTAAVWGRNLIPVFLAIGIGPALSALMRFLQKLTRHD